MKYFAPLFLVVSVCIVNFIQADNIKCYECKSANDKNCIKNPKETNKVECRTSKTCAKYIMMGPTGTFVERGCSESLTWDKICYTAGVNASYNNMHIIYETCNKDKCNGSGKFQSEIFMTVSLVIISILSKNLQ